MNVTLIRAFLRQRFTSPVRLLILFAMFGFPLLFVHWSGLTILEGRGSACLLTLILAAGMIGQDVSSGVLQLLFARPVTRASYVLSRWAAVGMAGAGLAVLQYAIALALVPVRPLWSESLQHVIEMVLSAFGMAATVALPSALLPWLGDLAILFAISMVIQGLTLARFLRPNLPAVFLEIQNFLDGYLIPGLDLSPIFAGAISWTDLTSFLFTLSVSLLGAIWLVSRKELSYATR